ncbi:hypothetical protein SUNI508_04711 [Seiridium unicorne]|uniref:Uncharacterized protein n=1 Tax=Seiridium unicorne TaxID=138068 RepID=A0ABR2V790_9PEZI
MPMHNIQWASYREPAVGLTFFFDWPEPLKGSKNRRLTVEVLPGEAKKAVEPTTHVDPCLHRRTFARFRQSFQTMAVACSEKQAAGWRRKNHSLLHLLTAHELESGLRRIPIRAIGEPIEQSIRFGFGEELTSTSSTPAGARIRAFAKPPTTQVSNRRPIRQQYTN